ncbi:MAG: potassium/proton antiporter, partial [Candidatus Nanopelagicales bacterium]
MTLDGLAAALVVGAAIVLVSIVGARFAGRLGVPGLFLYLLLGLVLGASFPAFGFDDARLATVLGYSALVLILAQGGLTTRLSQLRPVMWPALTLATLGVLVSITVVAIPLVLLMDVDAQPAILIGAVLAATDAAAVFAVMRRMRIGSRVRTLLEAEAGFNDAPVVVLVSVVASGSFGTDPWWLIPIIVVVELVGGAAVGIAFGYAAAWLLRRIALPAVGLYPIAALALLVASYGVADLVHVSGFMAIYVAAVLLGSAARLPHRRSIVGFADGLSWIAEIGLFVMLGLLASVSRLPAAVPMALAVAVILVVLARPLAALASLAPYRWPRNVIAFASVAGLRGAVPIVFAAIPLGMGMPEAEMV